MSVKLTKMHKSSRVHLLVANAFLPPPGPEKTIVIHIDGDKCNNRVSNLRWGTLSEMSYLAQGDDTRVVQLTKKGEIVAVHDTTVDAANSVGVALCTINYAIKTGTVRSGHLWRRVEDVPDLREQIKLLGEAFEPGKESALIDLPLVALSDAEVEELLGE